MRARPTATLWAVSQTELAIVSSSPLCTIGKLIGSDERRKLKNDKMTNYPTGEGQRKMTAGISLTR